MTRIIDEVPGLYKIIEFEAFRKTEGVTFDMIPVELFSSIDSIDRVLHKHNAVSPSAVGQVKKPWYMHPYQEDNLIVLQGVRYVDIYSVEHGKVESFVVGPNSVFKNAELVAQGSFMLVWPKNVFHRIQSGEEGSASINIAVHAEGFDIKTNFSIYDLDVETGEFHVIRAGFLDQTT